MVERAVQGRRARTASTSLRGLERPLLASAGSEGLARLPREQSERAIVQLLTDPDEKVRIEAVRAAGTLGLRGTLHRLLQLLSQDTTIRESRSDPRVGQLCPIHAQWIRSSTKCRIPIRGSVRRRCGRWPFRIERAFGSSYRGWIRMATGACEPISRAYSAKSAETERPLCSSRWSTIETTACVRLPSTPSSKHLRRRPFRSSWSISRARTLSSERRRPTASARSDRQGGVARLLSALEASLGEDVSDSRPCNSWGTRSVWFRCAQARRPAGHPRSLLARSQACRRDLEKFRRHNRRRGDPRDRSQPL